MHQNANVYHKHILKLISQKSEEKRTVSEQLSEDEQLLQECDLLIIDDLGTEFVTKFTQAAIYNIINTRLNSGKPVIISTNLSTKELEDVYGNRMVSRIVGVLRKIEFYGSDIRQMKKMKK